MNSMSGGKEIVDLNHKNAVNSSSSVTGDSDYILPYGEDEEEWRSQYYEEGWYQDEYGDWYQDPKFSASPSITKDEDSNLDNNNQISSNVTSSCVGFSSRPNNYDEGWYQDEESGEWYNQFDWYQDDNGEWYYEDRSQDYEGYYQDVHGDWKKMEEEVVPIEMGITISQISEDKTDTATKENCSFIRNATASEDIFCDENRVSGENEEEKVERKREEENVFRLGSSDKPPKKLPPRPADYDYYWYQDDEGNWWNEYDDMGYEFDPNEYENRSVETEIKAISAENVPLTVEKDVCEIKSAANKKTSNNTDIRANESLITKLPPRPADYDYYWYEDEDGNWRNEYNDNGFEFDPNEYEETAPPPILGEQVHETFYTEEEIARGEIEFSKKETKNAQDICDNEHTSKAAQGESTDDPLIKTTKHVSFNKTLSPIHVRQKWHSAFTKVVQMNRTMDCIKVKNATSTVGDLDFGYWNECNEWINYQGYYDTNGFWVDTSSQTNLNGVNSAFRSGLDKGHLNKSIKDGNEDCVLPEATMTTDEATKVATEASKNLIKGLSSLGGELLCSVQQNDNRKSSDVNFLGGFGFGNSPLKTTSKGFGGFLEGFSMSSQTNTKQKNSQKIVSAADTEILKDSEKSEIRLEKDESNVSQTLIQRKNIEEERLFKPYTHWMNPKERWLWSFGMIIKINWLTKQGFSPEQIDEVLAEEEYMEAARNEGGYFDENGDWIDLISDETPPSNCNESLCDKPSLLPTISEEETKKTVTFIENEKDHLNLQQHSVLHNKPKFVKHINKTRTMSGKQKWEWAFEKIIQVRKNLQY